MFKQRTLGGGRVFWSITKAIENNQTFVRFSGLHATKNVQLTFSSTVVLKRLHIICRNVRYYCIYQIPSVIPLLFLYSEEMLCRPVINLHIKKQLEQNIYLL